MENKKLIESWQIGSDCEWFVQNDKKEIISAENLIRGTKYEPFQFDPNNSFFATSLDNVLAEGNIPPVTSKEDWLKNMTILRNYIDNTLPKGYCTVAIPAVRMDPKWLQTPTSKVFGCEPAYVVYTKEEKENPKTNTNLRSSALHVHVSFEEAGIETIEKLIKAMDLFLSIPAVLTEPLSERKQLYGTAGEFRLGQAYSGCEYRCLSSFWAETDEKLGWVYDNTENAIKFVNERFDLTEKIEKQVRKAINTNNKELAQKLINHYNIPILA